MYSQDSFFDLSGLGQVGLACLSLTLFALTVTLSWAVLRKRPVWVRIPGALVIFWMFTWLAPQVYYMYYLLLFDGLPLQWVIRTPRFTPVEALEVLVFQGPQNLSAHSQGILGWCVILVPFLRRRRTARPL